MLDTTDHTPDLEVNFGEGDELVVSMKSCPRCAEAHEDVLFVPLREPIELPVVRITYWATCPETSEPILGTQEVMALDTVS